jgi:hypothetical protein
MLLGLLLAGCSSPANEKPANEKPANAPCPKSVPHDGSSCATPGYAGPPVCSYGGNERGQCKTEANCSASSSGAAVWFISAPDSSCGQNATSCPSAFDMDEKGPCPAQSDCDYPEGVCSCVPCSDVVTSQASGFWHCKKWSEFDSVCLKAELGAPCSEPSGTMCFAGCSYCAGFPSVGTNATCEDGYWQLFVSTACSCAPRTCP